MTNPELELVWDGGSLDLMGENDTPYGPVMIEALADGTEWGNPQSVRRALFSALADGSASALERHDNRMPVVKLRLTAADSAALAGGEAPLHMLSTKPRVELRWTPPNDFAAPAAFILTESDLTHQMDDLAENKCQRFYMLSTKALPWALSVEPVVIEALPPFDAAPITLDDCSTTTGWTSVGGAWTFVDGGDYVSVVNSTPSASPGALLTKTLARAKQYLAIEAVDIAGAIEWNFVTFTTTSGSTVMGPAGIEGGWRFYELPAALGSVTSIRLDAASHSATPGEVARILTIAESDTPAASVGRQSLRVIPTPGSARAAGSLLVEARNADEAGLGDSLGQVIVYTGPQYDPRLSTLPSSTRTTDSAALSGECSTGTSHIYAREAREFPPGSYSVWLSAKGVAGSLVDWTMAVRATNPTTADTLAELTAVSRSSTLVGSGYNLIEMGSIDLPSISVDAASMAFLRFYITSSASTSVDEVLVFNRTLGTLSIVDTTGVLGLVESSPDVFVTTAGAARVWLDPASLEGQGGVVAGRGRRAHCLPVSVASSLRSYDGAHSFTPDATYLYVGTTGALDPKVTGTFRPAWHTHPAS